MVTLDTTIDLASVITWTLIICGFASTVAYVKLTLAAHHNMLFTENGEARLVSFEALARLQGTCKAAIANDYSHQNDTIKQLTSVISELSKKIDQLSRCVTVLAAGGTDRDC